jgi:hypothetical protein
MGPKRAEKGPQKEYRGLGMVDEGTGRARKGPKRAQVGPDRVVMGPMWVAGDMQVVRQGRSWADTAVCRRKGMEIGPGRPGAAPLQAFFGPA